ncbi:UTRA domain-containing protein, partial [Streptomyces microflavus]|uniref:UTRA domain-containing protein n=1 Tax=Streptomyces microflavus TaxID=1919 RepID=UPI0035D85060
IDVLSIAREVPPADVAERLQVSTDSESVVHRENHYFADDEPVQIVSTYLRWEEAEGTLLMQAKSGPNGIYGRLEGLGHVMTRVRDEISARMPSPEEARVLDLLPGVPVLVVLLYIIDMYLETLDL